MNLAKFFRVCHDVYGSNHSYCNLVGPFLQSAFHQFYLGCGSNRLCLGNSSSTYLHHCGCIIACLDILLHYLTSRRFTKVTSVFPDQISQHLIAHQEQFKFLFCGLVRQYCYQVMYEKISLVVPIFQLEMRKQTKSAQCQYTEPNLFPPMLFNKLSPTR